MATNLKGAGGIKGILLLHGEKIAIALVGAVALYFVYAAYKLPKLDEKFQAAKLQSEISQTSTAIKDFTWDKAVAEFPDKVKKAKPIEAKADPTVKPAEYTTGKSAFDAAIVAPLILRTDPVLLNVTDVRAFGGSGLFAFIDDDIRKQQELRRATEQAEADAKALEQQKRAQKDAEKGQAEGPGGARRGRGPEGAVEVFDPAHPKRRRIEGTVRPSGTQLQGGERIERAYWACVVAKVPIREQLKLYQDAFEKARGYDATKDFPAYVGFLVERAEVLPSKEKELNWKPVSLYDGQRQSIAQNKPLTSEPEHAVAKRALDKLANAAQMFWAGGMAPDVIDERLAEYPLTLPLPPLVGRDWGAEVTHPDIPPPPLEEEAQPVPTETPGQQQPGADSPFGTANPDLAAPGPAGGPGQNMRGFGAGPGAGFGRPRSMEMSPGGGPGMAGPGMPGRGREFGPEGSPGGGPGGGFRGAGSFAGHHTTLSKGVDYYLFRFFDFNVEPGKRYKYRVKLVMHDPNFNMPANVLTQAVLDRQRKDFQAAKAKNANVQKQFLFFRAVETWSDPSPPVGIPMAGGVRLAESKIPAAEKFNDEPSVKLMVEAFDVDSGGNAIQAGVEKDVRRGYVANLIEDAEYLVEGGIAIDTQPGFKFLTGMTVLDIAGGTKLTRELSVPARIMVMGPAGQLYIRNETDDKPFVEYHRLLFERTNDKNRGPGGGPEGDMPGGRPGGRNRAGRT